MITKQPFELPIRINPKKISYGAILANILLFVLVIMVNEAGCLSLKGTLTDHETGTPLAQASISAGLLHTRTDDGGGFLIDGIPDPGSYLLTATSDNYKDFSERIILAEEETIKLLELMPAGAYSGDAPIEYEITIKNPETGDGHVKAVFKKVYINEPVKMDMHYVSDKFISIENLSVVDEFGTSLEFSLAKNKQDLFYYELSINNGLNDDIILEYDIHYVSICHNGDESCYHAYIGQSYAVFENMNHILFTGASGYTPLGTRTAVRFFLPPGWVCISPWEQVGNYFIGNHEDIIYAAPAVGRFELHRLSIYDHEMVIGIHENANQYATNPEQWPVTIDTFKQAITAADKLTHFESRHSFAIGIPPLGPNEGAINSAYSPADNYPALFWNLCGMDDIRWYEHGWMRFLGEYFGDINLYFSGNYPKNKYQGLIQEEKDTYIEQVYDSPNDLPIPELEFYFGPDQDRLTAKTTKIKLFIYLLDHEIRRLTGGGETLTDALVYWRHNLGNEGYTNAEVVDKLNAAIGHDFTDFFAQYFFGNERYPVELDWDFSAAHPKANAGADQVVSESRPVQLDASGCIDNNNEITAYLWRQINGPTVILDDETSQNPTFITPRVDDQPVRVDFELAIKYKDILWDSDDVNILVIESDADNDGLSDNIENTTCTDPFNGDTDNDGISDGMEDKNKNGRRDSDETDPCKADTDGDGAQDGSDCNAVDSSINPGAIELCNGIDENCNGQIDEGGCLNAEIASFIARFYRLCLDRDPDFAGLDGWMNGLSNGTQTGSDVANGFVFSQEFLDKNTTDKEYLQVLYEAFFNRQPDAAGLQGWLDVMQNGASRQEVLNGFVYATEFAELCNEYGIKAFEGHITNGQRGSVEGFVTRFYQLCLDRDPDAAGLEGWSNNLFEKVQTGTDVAYGFILSREFIDKNTTNDEYLTILYRAFFNRDPDQAGWDVWIAELNAGADRGHILNGFLGSQEFISLCQDFGINPY